MSWITGMRARLGQLVGRKAAEARMDEEIRFHIEMETEKNLRAGMAPAEARRRAMLAFGGVEATREEMRDGRRLSLVEDLWSDARYAVRSLRAAPGFTAVAVGTLALGIGAGAAMFSVLDGVLLRTLPVRDEDRVAVVWMEAPARDSEHLPLSYTEMAELRERTRAFASVAGVAYQGAMEQVLVDAGTPLPMKATWVTGGFFPTLGAVPLHGRTLLPADDVPGAEPVMVISHGFWRRHFNGDPAAVGRSFAWNGKRFTVVGVMPRGFEYPRGADAWAPVLPDFPATLDAAAPPSEIIVFDLVGRLRPGVTVEAARADVEAWRRAGDPRRPPEIRGWKPVATAFPTLVGGDARPALWAASAAVGLLLLIACVNVANLLLIRGSARTRELAIRGALGAGSGRLIRQLLTESAALALLGGVLGIAVAFAAVRVLVALAPPELPRREMIGVDARVLLFALGTTVAAALLSGLLPALLSAARDPGAWLRGGTRGSSADRGSRMLRHGLVVGQVSLAILVVTGAGLLVRSLVALQRVEMGFDAERLLIARTTLPPKALPERPRQVALQEEMLARVAALPGVESVASLPVGPFSGEGGWTAMYTGEGQAPGEQATNPWVNFEVVGPGYFRTLQVPVSRGRAFAASDREDAPPVAIVSEAVARHTWPGQDPIGKRVKLGPADGPDAWHTVVGIVGETRYRELTTPKPSLYLPIRQFPGPVPMSLAVRTRTDPAALVPRLRRTLRDAHPELMLAEGASLRQLMASPLARPRFSTVLLGAFAAITLLLAAVGIYGAMATTVRQRTREMGIRLALGARAEEVRALVLRQGLRLALWGCAIGIAAALLATRLIRGLLFGVTPTDPLTFAAVAAIVVGAAALASWLPARRAARVDPVTSLRAE